MARPRGLQKRREIAKAKKRLKTAVEFEEIRKAVRKEVKRALRSATVKLRAAEPVRPEEIKAAVSAAMREFAKEIRSALAKAVEVREEKIEEDPLKRLALKNVPFHYAQKPLEKNVVTVYNSWTNGLRGEIKSFTNSISKMEAYVQALEKELEHKKRAKYVVRTLLNPLNWLHPISTYKGSAFAVRRRLRLARAELERLYAIKDLWLAICREELAVINKYFEMVKKQPTKQNAAAFGSIVTNIAMKHFELRNLTMTMVFGKIYQKEMRGMHKLTGTESVSAPSYVLKEVKNQPETVKKALAKALEELKRM